MAIRHVVTRGYGNGTFNGTIAEVVARGYIDTAAATATIGGKTAFTESELVAGSEVTTITLVNDTWVAVGATFDAQRQAIIDGFDSAQVEATGWNAEIRDKEVVGAVVRTSDTVVTITWTASPSYDVTSDETITLTVPAAAVTAAAEIIGTPTIGVTADVEAVVEDQQVTGGWYSWRDSYERHLAEKKKKAKEEEKARQKAKKIQSDIDRQLALAERELEETGARERELKRLTKLADKYQDTLKEISPRIELVTREAVEAQTYSKMERLERELARMQEEEDFLLMATEIILNA